MAKGHPYPQVEWLHNGRPVTSNHHDEMAKQSAAASDQNLNSHLYAKGESIKIFGMSKSLTGLIIFPSNKWISSSRGIILGVFTCVMRNSAGEDRLDQNVTLMEAPRIVAAKEQGRITINAGVKQFFAVLHDPKLYDQ